MFNFSLTDRVHMRRVVVCRCGASCGKSNDYFSDSSSRCRHGVLRCPAVQLKVSASSNCPMHVQPSRSVGPATATSVMSRSACSSCLARQGDSCCAHKPGLWACRQRAALLLRALPAPHLHDACRVACRYCAARRHQSRSCECAAAAAPASAAAVIAAPSDSPRSSPRSVVLAAAVRTPRMRAPQLILGIGSAAASAM